MHPHIAQTTRGLPLDLTTPSAQVTHQPAIVSCLSARQSALQPATYASAHNGIAVTEVRHG